jgi:CO dehydrogenase/acetyl-CoA synthase beta subunit
VELFDQQILDIRRFIKCKKEAKQCVHEIQCAGTPTDLLEDLPVRYGPDNPPAVILKEEAFVELGHPLQGSVSLVLWTRQEELIRDGRITRIGPDIQEAGGQSLPFGQVIMVGGSGFERKDLPGIERARNLSHLLDGYMIRNVPGKLWSRVSCGAARKGFSLEILGRVLMAHYRRLFASLEAMEILFVTSSKAEVEELEGISLAAERKNISVRKLTRTQEGIYECEEIDCETCSDKPVCDVIRDVIVIRKGGRITGVKIIREKATPS